MPDSTRRERATRALPSIAFEYTASAVRATMPIDAWCDLLQALDRAARAYTADADALSRAGADTLGSAWRADAVRLCTLRDAMVNAELAYYSRERAALRERAGGEV